MGTNNKEGVITHTEEYDAHQVAIRTLHKIKASRRGRRYRMIRVDHQTWKEVEITTIKPIIL